MTYIRTASSIGYQRKWDSFRFPAGTRCVELVDYVGDGEGDWNAFPGNAYGVCYCRAESFYRAFANATFGGPCIVEIGEMPCDEYDSRGEPVIKETTPRINMAAAFKGSDIQILPHGCSRMLIDNCNDMFADCTLLRAWQPTEMVNAGIAGVTDSDAPRILRSNGLAAHAFLYQLRPLTMKRMFANCTAYDGTAINAIDWTALKDETAAQDFAIGCHFAPHRLNAIIDSLHAVIDRLPKPLLRVNLGGGLVAGETAQRARELIHAGIDLQGFEIA